MIRFGYTNKAACIVRALVAIGLGAMMISINNFTAGLMKVIAVALIVLGAVSLVYGIVSKEQKFRWFTATGGLTVVALGLLLFFMPESMIKICLLIIGGIVFFGAVMQLFLFGGLLSLGQVRPSALILPIIVVIGVAVIFFTHGGMRLTSIIVGSLAVLYGVQELLGLRRVEKYVIHPSQGGNQAPEEQ